MPAVQHVTSFFEAYITVTTASRYADVATKDLGFPSSMAVHLQDPLPEVVGVSHGGSRHHAPNPNSHTHEKYSIPIEHRTPSPDDVWIAITGVTGAGKSTFISLFLDSKIEIGHGLSSVTKNVNIFRGKELFNNRVVWFVDTPGFDDTRRSNIDILEEIATYFVKLYDKGIRFSGLLYLQRITDPRMSGTAVKNLELFQLICGDNAASMVRLVTTRWNEVAPDSTDYQSCIDREKQLAETSNFFKPLIQKGAQLLKLEALTLEAGKVIIDSVLANEKKFVLNIQEEMLDRRMTLGQTSAGFYLDRECAALTRSYENELKELQDSLEEARRERDEEMLAMLGSEFEQCQSKQARLAKDQQNMTADFRELDARKARDLEMCSMDIMPDLDTSISDMNGHNPHHYTPAEYSSGAENNMDTASGGNESRRHRFKQYMSSEWHRVTSKDHGQARRSTLQEVQLWLWDMVEGVNRAKSRFR